jgi:hypothetical protein
MRDAGDEAAHDKGDGSNVMGEECFQNEIFSVTRGASVGEA